MCVPCRFEITQKIQFYESRDFYRRSLYIFLIWDLFFVCCWNCILRRTNCRCRLNIKDDVHFEREIFNCVHNISDIVRIVSILPVFSRKYTGNKKLILFVTSHEQFHVIEYVKEMLIYDASNNNFIIANFGISQSSWNNLVKSSSARGNPHFATLMCIVARCYG